MKKREINYHREYEAIFQTEKPPVELLADGFNFVLSRVLVESEWEMDLLRAMGDRERLIKEQIKNSTIQHALEVFGECYLRATGQSWDREGYQENKGDGND